MKLFKVKANAEFFAEDIDDAMKKLSDHFRDVMHEDKDSQLLVGGEIHVGPEETFDETL